MKQQLTDNQVLKSSVASACLLAVASTAAAAPTGADVVHGSVSISEAGKTTTIDVGGAAATSAIINWQDFSIAADETVNFVDNAGAVTLNRVTSDNVSKIYGNMAAQGKVFLVNPNGIVFGQNATINVGGLVASTTDIDDDAFKRGYTTGQYVFDQASTVSGANILIDKGADITIKSAGFAALVAPSVTNEGIIRADLDKIVLAGGDIYTLDLYGDDLITFDATSTLEAAQVSITKTGEIVALNNSVDVVLTAAVADSMLESLVNVDGYIEANHVVLSGDTVTLASNSVDATTADVYYTSNNYNVNVDYTGLINGDVTSYKWVHNADDLQSIDNWKRRKNVLSSNYALSGDIDLENEAFNSIGKKRTPFTGIFDFNGYEVQNLSIDNTTPHTGLFASTTNATIIDADINGATVHGGEMVGVLVGTAQYTDFIGGIEIDAQEVSGTSKWVGGAIGYAASVDIQGDVNVNIDGDITGTQYVGGAFGTAQGVRAHDAVNVDVAGDISGTKDVGGLAGYSINSVFHDDIDVNVNNVSASGDNAGGVFGNARRTRIQDHVVVDVTVDGDVTAQNNAGGFAGYLFTKNNQYNLAKDGEINIDVLGNVSATNNVGGFIGNFKNNTPVTIGHVNIDADIEVSGTNAGGFIGQSSGKSGTLVQSLTQDTNLIITNTATNNIGGVIGFVNGNDIEFNNIDITQNDINAGHVNNVGGYFGQVKSATITGDFLNTAKVTGNNNVGGVTGASGGNNKATYNGTYTNTGNIEGQNSVGGIFGDAHKIKGNGVYLNSGNVTGVNYVGGIAGDTTNSILSNAGNTGNITGVEYVGGVTGRTGQSTLTNVFQGNSLISGENIVGGIAGENVAGGGGRSLIDNAISFGTVEATAVDGIAGGIAGKNNRTINNAISLATVNADMAGALVGENAGTVTDSLIDSSVNANAFGVPGNPNRIRTVQVLDTAAFEQESTYTDANFDMSATWELEPNSYANMQWCGALCTVASSVPVTQPIPTPVPTPTPAPAVPQVTDASENLEDIIELLKEDEKGGNSNTSIQYQALTDRLNDEQRAYVLNHIDQSVLENSTAIETISQLDTSGLTDADYAAIVDALIHINNVQ